MSTEALKPFICLGVDLREGSGDAEGDCPFCGKDKHFHVNPRTGQYNCKVCGDGGNVTTFLTKIAELAHRETPREKFRSLSRQRGIPAGVLRACGMGWWNDEWLIPVRSERGTVRDIRRYDGERIMSTGGCKLQLWGMDRLAAAPAGATVYLHEGEWDGQAMMGMLRDAGDDGPVVVAVPGATVLKEDWVQYFAGKHVVTFYDNDEPGDKGQLRAEARLRSVAASLRHVCWPEDDLPEGWDVRDHAREYVPKGGARRAIDRLLAMATTRTRRRAASDGANEGSEVQPPKWTEDELPDLDFPGVVAEFDKYLVMSEDVKLALKLMAAVCLSNDIDDDPLWLYVIAPPSAGKTELLSQFQESSRCVFVSSVTPHGLVSGWKGEGSKDPSLIPKLKGKSLVTKDFTEILAMPEVAQNELYSILRGAYDGFVDKTYGNGVQRRYRDCHFSVIAGSTQAIRLKRNSTLGERFLQFEMGAVTERQEFDRCMSSLDNIGKRGEKNDKLQRAVCAFLKRKIDPEDLPKIPTELKKKIVRLARMVAALRTEVIRDRFTQDIQVKIDRESPTRLTKQLGKLAMVLAFIDGNSEVDDSNVGDVARVAINTIGGFGLDIVEVLMGIGGRGTKRDMCEGTRLPSTTVTRHVNDLLYLRVLEVEGDKTASSTAGGKPASVYRVTDEVADMWKSAKGDESWSKDKSSSGRPGAHGSTRSPSSSASMGRRSPAASGVSVRSLRLVKRATSPASKPSARTSSSGSSGSGRPTRRIVRTSAS